MIENESTEGIHYRVILSDGTVFWTAEGKTRFTLDTARMYARWMGGTVEPIVLLKKTESA